MEDKRDEDMLREILRKKAQGYDVEEIKEITEESGEDGGKRKVERVVRRVLPDLEAAKLLLTLTRGAEDTGITVVSHVPRPRKKRLPKGE